MIKTPRAGTFQHFYYKKPQEQVVCIDSEKPQEQENMDFLNFQNLDFLKKIHFFFKILPWPQECQFLQYTRSREKNPISNRSCLAPWAVA